MYRTYAQEISKDLKDTEVEVCLGVRLHDPEPIPWSDEDEDEEDDTDEFMASQGFELICIGHRETSGTSCSEWILSAALTIFGARSAWSSSTTRCTQYNHVAHHGAKLIFTNLPWITKLS